MRCGSRNRVHEVYRKTDKHENPRADQGRSDRVVERFEMGEQLAQTHGCILQPAQQASLHQAPCIYVQDAWLSIAEWQRRRLGSWARGVRRVDAGETGTDKEPIVPSGARKDAFFFFLNLFNCHQIYSPARPKTHKKGLTRDSQAGRV